MKDLNSPNLDVIKKKKRLGIVSAVLCVLLFLNGCAAPSQIFTRDHFDEMVKNLIDGDVWEEDTEFSSATDDGSADENSDVELPKITVNESPVSGNGVYDSSIEKGYFYSQLSDTDKILYSEIYTIINNMATDVMVRSLNADNVDRVFQCVMDDHPELFFVEGYSMSKYMTNGRVTSLSFSGKYTKTSDERKQCQTEIDNYVNQCLLQLPVENDYDKVRYIYEYLINHTEYERDAKDNQNICSVMIGGKSVCQGYAKATQYLLEKAEIPCILVAGTVTGGESHAWNIAKVDGNWCYVDTTWGDASYQTINQNEELPGINYDYLCVNDELLKKTHYIQSGFELPVCSSLDNYYYVKEGTYFTEPDFDKLQALFDREYEKGAKTLTIKCSDAYVYQEILDGMIAGERIFSMLRSPDSVRYARMEDRQALLFYL